SQSGFQPKSSSVGVYRGQCSVTLPLSCPAAVKPTVAIRALAVCSDPVRSRLYWKEETRELQSSGVLLALKNPINVKRNNPSFAKEGNKKKKGGKVPPFSNDLRSY